jgi:hypothetical protein
MDNIPLPGGPFEDPAQKQPEQKPDCKPQEQKPNNVSTTENRVTKARIWRKVWLFVAAIYIAIWISAELAGVLDHKLGLIWGLYFAIVLAIGYAAHELTDIVKWHKMLWGSVVVVSVCLAALIIKAINSIPIPHVQLAFMIEGKKGMPFMLTNEFLEFPVNEGDALEIPNEKIKGFLFVPVELGQKSVRLKFVLRNDSAVDVQDWIVKVNVATNGSIRPQPGFTVSMIDDWPGTIVYSAVGPKIQTNDFEPIPWLEFISTPFTSTADLNIDKNTPMTVFVRGGGMKERVWGFVVVVPAMPAPGDPFVAHGTIRSRGGTNFSEVFTDFKGETNRQGRLVWQGRDTGK